MYVNFMCSYKSSFSLYDYPHLSMEYGYGFILMLSYYDLSMDGVLKNLWEQITVY